MIGPKLKTFYEWSFFGLVNIFYETPSAVVGTHFFFRSNFLSILSYSNFCTFSDLGNIGSNEANKKWAPGPKKWSKEVVSGFC